MARRSDQNHSIILHVETSAQNNELHLQNNEHHVSIDKPKNNNTNNCTLPLSTSLCTESYKPVYAQKTVVGSNMYTMQSRTAITPIYNMVQNSKNEKANNGERSETKSTIEDDLPNDLCENIPEEHNLSYEYTDEDLNEVLISSSPLYDEKDKSFVLEGSEKIHHDNSENHYMPMIPKKPNDLSTISLDILSSIKNKCEISEENAYIEMLTSNENCNDNKQTYEHIDISSNTKKTVVNQQLEPLYMELSLNNKESSLMKNFLNLSKILKEPTISNSTSSLNKTTSTNKHLKRLSLSDTFRPASYYLATVKESQAPINYMSKTIVDEREIRLNEKKEMRITQVNRRLQNLSFDTVSSKDMKSKLNINQSGSQISLPESFTKMNDKTEETTLIASCCVNHTSIAKNSSILTAVENVLKPDSPVEKTCKMPVEMTTHNIQTSDVCYITPPEGFTNTNDEPAETTLNNLCESLSNSQLECFYDSLEDVNKENEQKDIMKSTNKNMSCEMSMKELVSSNSLSTNVQSYNQQSVSEAAPYYYSDITQITKSELDITDNFKLNNLKDVAVHKAGISHIHNIIINNIQEDGHLNNDLVDIAAKQNGNNARKSYEHDINKLNKNIEKESERTMLCKNSPNQKNINTLEANGSGDQHWEEDSIWCERLRILSHRHTKSLDELNWTEEDHYEKKLNDKKQNSKLTRGVTYVNDDIMPIKKKHMDKRSLQILDNETENYSDEADDVYVQLAVTEDLYETLREEDTQKKIFSIDREKIRQWDLMSSGLHLTSTSENTCRSIYNEKNKTNT